MNSSYAIAPVVTGLAVGIAFVVLFSAIPMPGFMLSDRELVSKYSELAQVKYFLDRYPDAKAEVSRYPKEDNVEIVYSVERQAEQPSGLYKGINTLGLHVYTRPDTYHSRPFELSCKVDQGMTIGWTYADTSAIDEAERTCFHGEYPPVSHDFPRQPIQ